MKVLYCIIASLLLCAFYVTGIDILEKYVPVFKWDVGMGITFSYSVILLLLTMLMQMTIKLYIKRWKFIALLPLFIPMLYWLSYYDIFPYRSFFLAVLSCTVCIIYHIALKVIICNGYKEKFTDQDA